MSFKDHSKNMHASNILVCLLLFLFVVVRGQEEKTTTVTWFGQFDGELADDDEGEGDEEDDEKEEENENDLGSALEVKAVRADSKKNNSKPCTTCNGPNEKRRCCPCKCKCAYGVRRQD